ncbi:MAG: CinA family nicotinamide mononucleotide deamidase-related protein [Chitinophagaceae bacterium]|nr:MAG: CinA family nicotinamide mononucleotide deamidase-related protein [Chitinophagaceae bacterium]
MKKVNTSIITIGDELLMGQTINTNSAWMSQELNRIGIWVHRQITIGDNWNDIWNVLQDETSLSDIIILTGGLGPTADDITKPLLCKYFGGQLIMNEEALQNIKNIFTRLNRPLIERNMKQAEVPDSCSVLQNRRGTAPGMLFSRDGKIIISLPGVPYEMKGLMEASVIPYLKNEFVLPTICYKTMVTAGKGESFIAEQLVDFEKSLPHYISLAYLPAYVIVKLRLKAIGENKKKLEKELHSYFEILKKLVAEILVSDEDKRAEELIGEQLIKSGKTVATAESCTGGYIAHLISSVPGASNYFKGSMVSYSNEIKENVLNVSPQTLEKFGAVSEEVVSEMFYSIIEKMKVEYAIAVSGIMGPLGDSNEKQVGTVWIAVGSKERMITKKLVLPFDRTKNIESTSQLAIILLLKIIPKN